MMSNVKKKDVPLISISLVAILFIAAALSLFPQQSADAANAIYTFVTRTLGSAVQVLVLLAMGLVIYLATSKYGNIRLGEGKPEYSTLSWLFMFICAGLGSSTLYWGVAEWAYYYQTPGLNIAPRSQQALEFREGANKQVISSQADSLIKISRIWADFFPANTSNQPI